MVMQTPAPLSLEAEVFPRYATDILFEKHKYARQN